MDNFENDKYDKDKLIYDYRQQGRDVTPDNGWQPGSGQTPPKQEFSPGAARPQTGPGPVPPNQGYQPGGGNVPPYHPGGWNSQAGHGFQPGPEPAGAGYYQGQAGQARDTVYYSKPKRKNKGEKVAGPVISLRRSTAVVIAVLLVVICGAAAVGGGFMATRLAPATHSVTSGSGLSLSVDPNGNVTTTEAVAKKVGDSVVGITSTFTVTNNNPFFGPQSSESGGVGTGMIIDAQGYILSNSHVVLDGSAEKIDVLLADGATVSGKLIWNDASVDLAVLKIDPKNLSLSPVELGDSDEIPIGSYVAAIGNPLGLEFNNSITQGVVSGLNRSITVSDDFGNAVSMEGLIQVDAAINSGNSGGPLLNSKGQVIGINTAKASADGMGFAIPINTAKPIIEKVIKTGNFERVYMGVSAANAADISDQYPSLKLNVKNGAFITAVTIGSPADDAGLLMKDVITKVDGKAISDSEDLIKTLLNYSVGDTVTVTYVRNDKEATVQVKLKSQKDVYGATESQGSGNSGSGSDNGNQQNPFDWMNPDGDSSEGGDNPFSWGLP